jgi:hypothetical protein
MSDRSFDLEVSFPGQMEEAAGEDLDWLELELDVRRVSRPLGTDPIDPRARPVAGSNFTGCNTCGFLSGCAGSGCGGVTCTCSCGGSCPCIDFSNGCDF